jgi:hypothetical protein
VDADEIRIEGLTVGELLALPREEIKTLVFCGKPIVFSIGTAEVLGQFRLEPPRLVVELAQIDGGGEGVLKTLWRVSEWIARDEVDEVEWVVHALNCANPNPKLRRVLEKVGFTVTQPPGESAAYRYVHRLRDGRRPS